MAFAPSHRVDIIVTQFIILISNFCHLEQLLSPKILLKLSLTTTLSYPYEMKKHLMNKLLTYLLTYSTILLSKVIHDETKDYQYSSVV